MKIACIVEGSTEYYCVPCILGRLGHIVIKVMTINGTFESWEKTIRTKVVPRALRMAQRNPDKIVVALDRENREPCCPDLAASAKAIIEDELSAANLQCALGIVISDPEFESTIFADYGNVDALAILCDRVSHGFGPVTDGVNVLAHVNAALRPGASYDKVVHGHALSQKLSLENGTVLGHNRALRKLVKEGGHGP